MPDEEIEAIWKRVYTAENIRNEDPYAVITADEAAAIWADARIWAPIVQLALDLERELVKGERCAVCGMTAAQAKAANYDCVREC